MTIKKNRYNIFNIKMQLLFAFKVPESISKEDRVLIEGILPRCAKNLPIEIASVKASFYGVEIIVSMSPEYEISIIINALKTHSTRQLGDATGNKKPGLWLRGYVANSLGEPVECEANLSGLINKNVRVK